MKDLLVFMLKGILGKEKFEVTDQDVDGRSIYEISTDPKNLGFVIGKGGNVIKSLRNILKVRATLEKRAVSVEIKQ